MWAGATVMAVLFVYVLARGPQSDAEAPDTVTEVGQ
jgi:hypothetical protein